MTIRSTFVLAVFGVLRGCSLVHDYNALGDGVREGGAGVTDADAADATDAGKEAGAEIHCGDSLVCRDGAVCCADPALSSSRTCGAASACSHVALVCDDATDCGDPAKGARCCLWKEGTTINVACLLDQDCVKKNSSAELCDPSAACPKASERCTATSVIQGYSKCVTP